MPNQGGGNSKSSGQRQEREEGKRKPMATKRAERGLSQFRRGDGDVFGVASERGLCVFEGALDRADHSSE